MKITDISVTKKGRYALFVDGEFLFSAEEEALVRSGLRPGMETDIQTLEALRRESEYIYGREWALHLLEYKAYSRRMLLDRLRRQIDEDIAEQVADRLCARAGSKDYGAITAVLNYYGAAEKLFRVPAGNFMPAPKVDSAVVRIRLWQEKPVRPADEKLFFDTIRLAFEQRRKTLANALSAGFPDIPKDVLTGIITDCGHRADIRGERLDTAAFAALSDRIGIWQAQHPRTQAGAD